MSGEMSTRPHNCDSQELSDERDTPAHQRNNSRQVKMTTLIAQHMIEEWTDEVVGLIVPATELYYRLILIVGRGYSGKTRLLRSLEERIGGTHINVGLEMSKRLLDAERQQWPLHASEWFGDLVTQATGEPVLLDNLEVLFHPMLQLDPLPLLQRTSRSRTIIAAWRGAIENRQLTYATAGHPEFRRYLASELLTITLSEGTAS